MSVLHLTFDHMVMLATMPLHHREPFDRTIVAQALVEDLPVVSADSTLDADGIQRIW